MTVVADLDGDRLAWLAERRNGVGASDVAGIGGVSPWASPWSVWAGKVGLTPLDDGPPAAHLTFGRDLEPLIRAWFHRHTGLRVEHAQDVVRHPEVSWQFATIDGDVHESPLLEAAEPLGVFESKYTAEAPWETIPLHYQWQVAWQLHVTGQAAAWLACLHLPFGRPVFKVYEVARDDALIAAVVAVVERFWFDHVVTGIPPLADDSRATDEAIRRGWGHLDTVKVPTVELDDLTECLTEYCDLKRKVAAANKLIEFRKNRLLDAFVRASLDADLLEGGAPSEGTVAGQLAASWRAQSRTDIDARAVRADHGDRYDRTTTIRVLRLHGRYLP